MSKQIFATLLVVMMSAMTVFAQGDERHKTTKKTVTLKTKIYCDHCAKCETCKNRLENKVYELKGIRSVELDVKNETIMVIYNPKYINETQIKEQVAASGYDADDVKASEEQIEALDACCKKPE